jgi:hypothetical protein
MKYFYVGTLMGTLGFTREHLGKQLTGFAFDSQYTSS